MPANMQGRSVLVVEDDPEILTTVKAAFDAAGARVTTATDGNKAVEMASRTQPDLIVLDMMMPKRSGFLVMETIKPDHRSGTKPFVIMITGNEGKRHELYARHLGVDDYINKPFSLDRLMESACKLLGCEWVEPEAI